MAAIPEPIVRATQYEVTCVPEDIVDADSFAIQVEYRGRDLWAVVRGSSCLSTSGQWNYEGNSSAADRSGTWCAEHRFDEETALRLAKEAAPNVTVNGYTVADALKMRRTG